MGTATNSSPSVILGGCLMRLLPIRVAGSCCCAGNTRAMVEVEERRQAASRFPREGCPPSTRDDDDDDERWRTRGKRATESSSRGSSKA